MDDNNESIQSAPETGATETNAPESTPETIINQAVGEAQGAAQGAPDVYDFTSSLPEGYQLSEDFSNSFSEVCRGMNLTNEQANQMAAYGYQWQKQMMDMQDQAIRQQAAEEAQNTIRSFGADFDAARKDIGFAVTSLEKEFPGFTEAIDNSGLGNNEAFCRAMVKVGKMMREDPGVGGADSAKKADNLFPNTDWDKL